MSEMEKRATLQMFAALPPDMRRGVIIGVQIGQQMQQAETQAHAEAEQSKETRPA
jgi:surface antigen